MVLSAFADYGYLTNCKDSGGGGNDQIQQCTFTRLGRLGQDDRQDTAQETFLDKNETTPRSSAIGYPRRVPHYNEYVAYNCMGQGRAPDISR